MRLVEVDREFIKKTVEWWQNHTYATHGDILRVEAFRKLDAATASHEEVSTAYGSTGWANLHPCVECGDVEHQHVAFNEVEVCVPCVEKAASLVAPASKSIFSWFKKG